MLHRCAMNLPLDQYPHTNEGMSQFFDSIMPELQNFWLETTAIEKSTDLVLFIPETHDALWFVQRDKIKEAFKKSQPDLLNDGALLDRLKTPAGESFHDHAFWTIVILPDGVFCHRVHFIPIVQGGIG